MTLSSAIFVYVLAMTFLTSFILGRAIRVSAKLGLLALCLIGPPFLVWITAIHAAGTGWGLGLVAIVMGGGNLFAAITGWAWRSVASSGQP